MKKAVTTIFLTLLLLINFCFPAFAKIPPSLPLQKGGESDSFLSRSSSPVTRHFFEVDSERVEILDPSQVFDASIAPYYKIQTVKELLTESGSHAR